ncbi:nucleotidyltransferase domain-containing protein [Pseudacidobacterium ailaaui]|jgi:hypothetical protein|uniref:nucleotidyltransferase domain-containing protein n=1 Tax=Pseudacidobacterium ailaaui TaxID=1382359 RepID=UPI00047DCA83|nr:nucleotidyltransferase family protein [Pseudacidobacterium ailaaui]
MPLDECRLLLACVQTALGLSPQEDVCLLLERPCDWERFLELAGWHGVVPLVHLSLREQEAVPAEVRQRLHRYYTLNAQRSLHLLGAQLRIHQWMTARGLRLVSWKGPIMGKRLYGNNAWRESCDLDFLAHPNDFKRVLEAFLQMGYVHGASRWTAEQLSRWHQAQHEARLFHPETRTAVELHDAVLPEYFLLKRLNAPDLIVRAQPLEAHGHLLCLQPEDEFLALCGHGTKHSWDRLKWICDIVQFLRTYAHALDAQALMDHARTYCCTNVVLLGTGLAQELFRIPLPQPLESALQRHRLMRGEAARLAQRFLSGGMGAEDDAERSRLHLAVMQGPFSKAGYLLRKLVWINPEVIQDYRSDWRWRIRYYSRRLLHVTAKGLRLMPR